MRPLPTHYERLVGPPWEGSVAGWSVARRRRRERRMQQIGSETISQNGVAAHLRRRIFLILDAHLVSTQLSVRCSRGSVLASVWNLK